ncbi:MAG: hypothetical protein IJT12_09260 [Paludibacteraceae bacterium]|nr:hypothetical protein [Paludibacteraceae bacterium]
MAVFTFYKFTLNEPSLKKETFSDFKTGSKLDLKVAQQLNDGGYDDHFGMPKVYNNDIIANHDNILVMTIENNKKKETTIEKKTLTHEHHPFCHVIIDYRDGQNLIAIERNMAFDNKPEKVREILYKALNRLFFRDNLQIDLQPLTKSYNDIWDAINTIRRRYHDRVKKICMDFSSNRNKERKVDSNALAAIIAEISEKTNAKGMVAFQSQGNEEMDLNAIQQDLLNIAEICLNEGEFDLSVHFYSYGVFRYGTDVTAQYGIDQEVIDDFVLLVDAFDMDKERIPLPRWLNNVKDIFHDFDTTAPTIIEPKRGHRR